MSCNSGCCNDIHTLHAELIHAAAEIQFALSYIHNSEPASITDIDNTNVQAVLEKYFSLQGIPIFHEAPQGLKNNVNLHYETTHEFIPGTLQVILSGVELNGEQSDPDRDFTVDTNNKGFTIELAPSDRNRLSRPPQQGEPLHVNYRKRITFNTRGGT